MFNKWLSKIESKYVKIAVCAVIAIVAAFLIIACLYALAPAGVKFGKILIAVIKPIILGVIICYLLSPVVGKLEFLFQKRFGAKKWVRMIAILICFLVVLAIFVVAAFALISAVFKQVSQYNFNDLLSLFNETKLDVSSVLSKLENYLSDLGVNVTNLSSSVTNAISSATSAASTFLFGIIFSIYFLYDGDNIGGYWKNICKKIFPDRARGKMRELAKDADKCFSGYIRGQFIDALIVGVVASIALSIAGMRYALVIGLIMGLGNLIPMIGPVFGYIAIIIINLLNWDFKMMIIGLIIVAVIMVIDSNVINPRLLAGNIEIHPLLVIAALIAGGAVGGLLGMLVAVPLAGFCKIQFEKWADKKDMLDKAANRSVQTEDTGSREQIQAVKQDQQNAD